MKVLLSRFAGFSAVPLISFVAPLFLLPIIPNVFGLAAWGSVGTAQAVGTVCAIVAGFGWNISGGARIALSADDDARRQLFGDSFWCRGLLVVAAGLVGAALSSALVPPEFRLVAALVTLATTAAAMTVVWYAVGVGDARVVLLFETVPVSLSVALAIPLLLLTEQLLWYPVLTLIGFLTGPLLLNLRLYRRPVPPFAGRRILRAYRANVSVAAAETIGGTYTSAPIPLAQGLLGATASGQATSADKFFRIALFAVTVLSNTLQKWVLEVSYAHGRARRHLVAFGLHTALALFGGTALALLGPVLSTLLFGRAATPEIAVFLGFGATFALTSLTTPFIRNVLVPAGLNRYVLYGTLGAAVVGVPLMIWASQWGLSGIIAGLAASELVILAVVGSAGTHHLLRERRAAFALVAPSERGVAHD